MHTIDDVKVWVLARAKEGMYPGAGARIRRTAIEQLTTVLGKDESRDPEWVLGNIEQISQRWAAKHPQANPATMNTYRSRAKATLREFLDFEKDPAKYRPDSSASMRTPKTRKRIDGAPTAVRALGNELPATAASLPMPEMGETQSFSFALSSGRRAHLAVPTNLTRLDIKLIKKQIELLELQVESPDLARKEGK
jgi:hypothetical protein